MADKWTPWKSKMTRAVESGDINKARKVGEDFNTFCEQEGWPDWWMDIDRQLSDMAQQIQDDFAETWQW